MKNYWSILFSYHAPHFSVGQSSAILQNYHPFVVSTHLYNMKILGSFLLLFITIVATAQPPLIHAHNDYEKPQPLTNALQQKVFSIEADVFLINDSIRVAHDEGKAATAPTLAALYLQPIVQLFTKHKGYISSDTSYSPILMIDIKKNGEAVLSVLQQQLAAHPTVFDRTVNPKAIQIVISGDRGPVNNWKNYPPSILFDGRPNEEYDSATLGKVAFISDAFYNYIKPAASIDSRIQKLATTIHFKGKLLRLWAIPDNPPTWQRLVQLGVDIINTDKVSECSDHFNSAQQ